MPFPWADEFLQREKEQNDERNLSGKFPGIKRVRREHRGHAEQDPADDVVDRRRADGHCANGGALQFHLQQDPTHDWQRRNGKRHAQEKFKAELGRFRCELFERKWL